MININSLIMVSILVILNYQSTILTTNILTMTTINPNEFTNPTPRGSSGFANREPRVVRTAVSNRGWRVAAAWHRRGQWWTVPSMATMWLLWFHMASYDIYGFYGYYIRLLYQAVYSLMVDTCIINATFDVAISVNVTVMDTPMVAPGVTNRLMRLWPRVI